MHATALGLLVLDEPFDVWEAHKVKFDYGSDFDEWWKQDVSSNSWVAAEYALYLRDISVHANRRCIHRASDRVSFALKIVESG